MTRRKGESLDVFRIRKREAEYARRNKDRDAFKAERARYRAKYGPELRKRHYAYRWRDIDAYNAKVRAGRNDNRRAIEKRSKAKVPIEVRRERGRRYAATQRAKGNHWKYIQFKEEADPSFLLARRIRCRINMAFRKAKNGTRKLDATIKLLGCSFNEFKLHIEKQFKDGMDWEAVMDGRIHIDHIKAVSTFDLTDPLQQKLAFHFSNCQPLWAADNISKGNRVVIPFKAA